MTLEALDIPMHYGKLAIGVVALTHALFATFIVGSSLIGVATETVGWMTRKTRYDRLARTIAFTLIFTTAAVSFLGVTLIFALNIFWPRFWSTLFRIMFWPLLLEAAMFLGEAIFAYAWFYSWDWAATSPGRKRLHLLFGWLAAGCALTAMFVIDMVASYMLTPRPPELVWDRLFNPTMIHLHLHRWFGNLTWTGFGLSALCAVGFLRAKTAEDRRHYDWAGGYCFTIGFGALLLMPVIGYEYLLRIRYEQPQAFHTLMLGGRSWLFDLVALFYSLLIVLGTVYILRGLTRPPRNGSSRIVLPASLAVVILAGILFSIPYHLQHIPGLHSLTDRAILPLGKMQPNKYFAMAFLVMFGLMNWLYFFRSFHDRLPWWDTKAESGKDRLSPLLLVALSLCAMLMMLTMGWARETARAYNGYLIYGVMSFEQEAALYQPAPTEQK
ncbi:MAG: Cytochrome bd-type quinol oxidase subunit 1-like protein [Nitrospira sp.]|jgi:cytochrome d ubiquinol oxidase subunit I|nr:Cytochrome bd-type quinol oxidase subunit 1-like protein [Nitrospira sp.]